MSGSFIFDGGVAVTVAGVFTLDGGVAVGSGGGVLGGGVDDGVAFIGGVAFGSDGGVLGGGDDVGGGVGFVGDVVIGGGVVDARVFTGGGISLGLCRGEVGSEAKIGRRQDTRTERSAE
mmetsp:Transcript_6634/g.8848  ORF Transcript_6634/g.8848 Transcript_6634/m.8848 type:complete len:119 (-) Transcript_6634:15-371(-)